MKIAIICSLAFAKEAGAVRDELIGLGHRVSLPFTVADILDGKTSVDAIAAEKEKGTFARRAAANDLIRRNYDRMCEDDVVLVVTGLKNGIENYMGANTFLEVGYAYILRKPIYFWDDIPSLPFYQDELAIIAPIALHKDLSSLS